MDYIEYTEETKVEINYTKCSKRHGELNFQQSVDLSSDKITFTVKILFTRSLHFIGCLAVKQERKKNIQPNETVKNFHAAGFFHVLVIHDRGLENISTLTQEIRVTNCTQNLYCGFLDWV